MPQMPDSLTPRAAPRHATLVLAGMAAYAAVLCCACQTMFSAFAYRDFDLAIDAQTAWNILRGSAFSSLLGIPFLGNHMRLILLAVAPLCAVFPSPLLLLHLQTLALALGAWPLFAMAREDLPPGWAAFVALLYLVYPPLITMNLYEFHPVALACPLLLAALLFFRRGSFWKFAGFLAAAMLCQENISLIAIGLGACARLRGRRGRWVWAPLAAGTAAFALSVCVVMPRLNPGTVQFARLYAPFGDSLPGAVIGMLRRPDRALRLMLTPPKLAFVSALLAPLAYVSLLSPSHLLPAGLVLAQRLLSARASEASIAYHYQAEFIPFVFAAAVAGVRRALFLRRADATRLLRTALALFPAAAIAATGVPGRLRDALAAPWKDPEGIRDRRAIVRSVPPRAAVISTFAFLPHLAERPALYSLHHVTTGRYTLSHVPYPVPEADVVILDTLDPLTFLEGGFASPDGDRRLRDLLFAPGWEVATHVNNLLVFRRSPAPRTAPERLVAFTDSLPHSAVTRIAQPAGAGPRLAGFEVGPPDADRVADLTLYWRPDRPASPAPARSRGRDWNALISLRGSDTLFSGLVCPGSRIRPSGTWDTDGLVADRQRVRLRRVPAPGEELALSLRLVPPDQPAPTAR